MYGLNVSLGGHVHRPERQGSKLEINGTKHSLPLQCGKGGQKPFAQFRQVGGLNYPLFIPFISKSDFSVLLEEISTTNMQSNTDTDTKKQLPAKPTGR